MHRLRGGWICHPYRSQERCSPLSICAGLRPIRRPCCATTGHRSRWLFQIAQHQRAMPDIIVPESPALARPPSSKRSQLCRTRNLLLILHVFLSTRRCRISSTKRWPDPTQPADDRTDGELPGNRAAISCRAPRGTTRARLCPRAEQSAGPAQTRWSASRRREDGPRDGSRGPRSADGGASNTRGRSVTQAR